MTKIKICGITNYEDAAMAVELGADALGFIFAPSPRRITVEEAADIIKRLPPFVKTVGVFVNETRDIINKTIELAGLDLVQLHGDEPPEICGSLMPRTIKALRIKNDTEPDIYMNYRGKARALLLDTYSGEAAGGTGKTFNWDTAVRFRTLGMPIILAGGIGPGNIGEAISRVSPCAVDVNSGIEKSPGKKDPELMRKLLMQLKR